MSTSRSVLHRWLAAVVILLTVIGTARPAAAHTTALATEPASGSTLEQSPTQLLVRFATPVEISLGALRLVDQKGGNIALGVPEHPGGETTAVAASVGKLSEGGYVAVYQVLAADGHVTRGAFTFQVGRTSAPAPVDLVQKLSNTTERGALPFVVALARLLLYAGAMVAIGGLLYIRQCWPAAETHVGTARLLRVAAVVSTVASVALIGLAGAQASGRGLVGFTDGASWRSVLGSDPGKWWVLRTVGTMLIFILTLAAADIRQRRWTVGLGVAALATFAGMAKGGHGNSGQWPIVGVGATVIHMLAASAWVGGLVVALVALGTGNGIDGLRKFSRVALLSVVALVASGAAQSARQLRTWSGWDSGYGHTLRSKIIVVSVLIVIGGISRQMLRKPAGGPIKSRDLVGLEVLFATGVLALTVSLVAAPPPAPNAPKSFTTALVVGSRTADIILEPGGKGVNTVHVTVQNNDGSIKNPSALTIRLSNDASGIPAITAQPTQRLANHASFEGLVIPVAGEWKLEVLATYGGETVRFSTPVKIR